MSTAIIEAPTRDDVAAEPLFEYVDGQPVELPAMSYVSTLLSTRLTIELGIYLKQNPLGFVASETIFFFGPPVNRNQRPDLAYVSYQRWPEGKVMNADQEAWPVVPNLVIETICPTDLAVEVLDKVLEYFRAGAEAVWIIYPKQRQIYAFTSPTVIRVWTENDLLDGGHVLPKFNLPLKDLFTGWPSNGAS